jgi:hypothetical protein
MPADQEVTNEISYTSSMIDDTREAVVPQEDIEPIYPCPHCDKVYDSYYALQGHHSTRESLSVDDP